MIGMHCLVLSLHIQLSFASQKDRPTNVERMRRTRQRVMDAGQADMDCVLLRHKTPTNDMGRNSGILLQCQF